VTLQDLVPTLAAGSRASELLLVDDGSPDETVAAAMPFIDAGPRGSLLSLRLLRHRRNLGKGAAVRTGLAAARGRWRLIMDADNAATIREVEKLFPRVGSGVGLVAGSRVAPGAAVDAVPSRRLAGLFFKAALRVMRLDLLADTQCGFKLYRADLAEQVAAHGREDGYAFDLEHLLIARACGVNVEEVGIAWTHRDGGQVRPVRDGLRMLRRALSIRARARELAGLVRTLPATQPEARPEIVIAFPAARPVLEAS
ncbi:MAG TPA: glycosyltransferase, partial [Phycisphaerales bacterium]|nr:glycosyltransferase [Phycisphaerales bacterium]